MTDLAGIKGLSRPPRASDYESIIKGLRPFCDGEELKLRSSLMLMRDRAMATKANASHSGWALLDVVEREAAGVAMNDRCKVDDLREFQRLCINLVMIARGFDALYQPAIPGLEQGEAKNANPA